MSFPGGLLGIAFNLDEGEIGVVLLGDNQTLRAGDEVTRTGRVMDVPVGECLLGRVINPLVNRSTAKARLPRTFAGRSSARRRPLWTERPSSCPCRPD